MVICPLLMFSCRSGFAGSLALAQGRARNRFIPVVDRGRPGAGARQRHCRRRRLGGDRSRQRLRGAGAVAADRREGQGAGDGRLRLHRRPAPLGRIPCAAQPGAASGIERDPAHRRASRSCWSRAAAGRGAAGRGRSRRSSRRARRRTACGSKRATRAGGRFIDRYLLDGAPTAIDAAAARCALRGAGKIQPIVTR